MKALGELKVGDLLRYATEHDGGGFSREVRAIVDKRVVVIRMMSGHREMPPHGFKSHYECADKTRMLGYERDARDSESDAEVELSTAKGKADRAARVEYGHSSWPYGSRAAAAYWRAFGRG